MPALVTRKEPGRRETNAQKMERHLKYSTLSKAMYPEDVYYGTAFNPLEVPLLDILAEDGEKDYGWSFPSKEEIMKLQAN